MRYVRKREGSTETEINMAPLIDMTFILLIFFMVSSTFTRDMKIDIVRPVASSVQRAHSDPIRVLLDRNGGLFLDGAPVKPWMLQSRVRELIRSGATKTVLVVTDKLVPAQKLIEVVDQCRLAGADDVAVAAEKEFG
jgi:biopolymer transport protein ExbD